MLLQERLLLLVVCIPLLGSILLLLAATEPPDRHHLHHDTYSISRVILNTLVLVMIFMGALGSVIGWLCHLGVFGSDPIVPLAFFSSFQLSLLAAFIAMMRVQVMTYDDRMFVRPIIGRRATVMYSDIARMERVRSLFSPRFSDLTIHTTKGKRVRVPGLLDVEHMLVRINRFEVLRG